MKNVLFFLFLMPLSIFAQYKGGGFDGFSVENVNVTNWSVVSSFNENYGEFHKRITVSPNPFSDKIIISFAEAKQYSLSVFDILGKEIKKIDDIENNFELNLSELKNGVYILQLSHYCNTLVRKKIVKQ